MNFPIVAAMMCCFLAGHLESLGTMAQIQRSMSPWPAWLLSLFVLAIGICNLWLGLQ